jgi:hypothetical protein
MLWSRNSNSHSKCVCSSNHFREDSYVLLSDDELFTLSIQQTGQTYRFGNDEKNQVYYISIVTV